MGCSGSPSTGNLLASEDGGDGGGGQSADAPVGGDEGMVDGPAGPADATGETAAFDAGMDGTSTDDGSDGAVPDGTSDGAEPDGASDGTAPEDVSSEAAAPDGASEATVVDGPTDTAVPDSPADAAVPDGPDDVAAVDAPGDSATPDASGDDVGSGGPVDATVFLDAAADAIEPDGGSPDAQATGDATAGDAADATVLDATAADALGEAAPSDAGTEAAPADDAGCSQTNSDAQATCNALCNTAPVLPVTYSTQPPPASTGGGKPTPGIYYATGVVYYFPDDAGVDAGASGDTLQETAILSDLGMLYTNESVVSVNGGPQQTASFLTTGDGTNMLLTQTCPSAGNLVIPYSHSGDTITVYISGGGGSGSFTAGVTLTLQTPIDAGAPFEAGLADAASCSQPAIDAQQTACSSICNGATPIPEVEVSGSPPAGTGGTILDGTYFLTSRIQYSGTDGGTDGGTPYTVQETLVLSTSGGITIAQDIQNSNGQPDQTITATFVPSDPSVYLMEVCPNAAQKTLTYTVSGNTVTFYEPHGAGGFEESVFTRQ
jgi:hypothetical protein